MVEFTFGRSSSESEWGVSQLYQVTQSSRCNIIREFNDDDEDSSANVAKKLICMLSNFTVSI